MHSFNRLNITISNYYSSSSQVYFWLVFIDDAGIVHLLSLTNRVRDTGANHFRETGESPMLMMIFLWTESSLHSLILQLSYFLSNQTMQLLPLGWFYSEIRAFLAILKVTTKYEIYANNSISTLILSVNGSPDQKKDFEETNFPRMFPFQFICGGFNNTTELNKMPCTLVQCHIIKLSARIC